MTTTSGTNDPDSIPDGSGTDASSGDSEQDTTSGGAPEQPDDNSDDSATDPEQVP